MAYDPTKRNGWARGLIHFHTQFSDGWAKVLRAGEIAAQAGYDFLIVTDHLRNLRLFTHRTLQEYVAACDEATARLGIPVIPGGEMEVHWNDPVTTDFSEAHTLAVCIRPLVAAGEFDPMPSFTSVHRGPAQIHLHLPVSYSEPRPRSVLVVRDGGILRWEPYAIVEPSIEFTHVDLQPPFGIHAYQLYVPSKFVSSPILFSS